MDKIKATLLILILACTGCSQHITRETYTVQGVQYTSEVKQNLFLYYTQTKQIEHITPFSSTYVGDIEAYPDPNSIKAVVEGAVAGLKGGGL